MKPLHKIQLQILTNLLFNPNLRYSDLKPSKDIENNMFDFHLDKMIEAGFVIKKDNLYSLTNRGKEYANTIDDTNITIQKQAKISAWVAPIREVDGEIEVLLYTRLKQPFYGAQGFMSGKVRYGETVIEAAIRELKEETNLDGKPEIAHIRHYLVNDGNSLVEDKFMFLCIVKDPVGELIPNNEGKFEWVKESEFKKYVTNHFESYDNFLADVKLLKDFKGEITLAEKHAVTDKF